MSAASDKKTVSEDIAYHEKVISGLRYAISSVPARTADLDRELVAIEARRERIKRDAETAEKLLPSMEARLEKLRAIDFQSEKVRVTKAPKGSPEALKLELLKIKEKLDSLGVSPEILQAFIDANPKAT